MVEAWCLPHVFKICKQSRPKQLNQVKYIAKKNSAFAIFLYWRRDRFIVYQLRTVSLFSNQDSKVVKPMQSPLSSSSFATSHEFFHVNNWPNLIGLNDQIKKHYLSSTNCSDSTSDKYDESLDNSSSEDFLHGVKSQRKQLSERQLLRKYTHMKWCDKKVTHLVASLVPGLRKWQYCFSVKFGGIKKLFFIMCWTRA